MPDWPSVHQELKRTGSPNSCSGRIFSAIPITVTATPQFCDRYKSWCQLQKRSMRQIRRGKALYRHLRAHGAHRVADTGRVRQAQVFVTVIGASNYTGCRATWSQSLPGWRLRKAMSVAAEVFGGDAGAIPTTLKAVSARLADTIPSSAPAAAVGRHYQVAVCQLAALTNPGRSQGRVQVCRSSTLDPGSSTAIRPSSRLPRLNQCIRALLNGSASARSTAAGNRT